MKHKHPSALADHLGYRLRRLSNHVSGSFAERTGRLGVSVPQWNVLRVLYDHDSLSLKDICERLAVDQGSLSRMMDRLIARGLITRGSDPADRRAISLALTPEGRRLVPLLAQEADENDRQFFDKLTPARKKQFLKLLHILLQDITDNPKFNPTK